MRKWIGRLWELVSTTDTLRSLVLLACSSVGLGIADVINLLQSALPAIIVAIVFVLALPLHLLVRRRERKEQVRLKYAETDLKLAKMKNRLQQSEIDDLQDQLRDRDNPN